MNIKRKSEYIGALGALLVHVAVIALLILVSFAVPRPDEEVGGVPVMMGDVDMAQGNFDLSAMVDVDVLPEETPEAQPQPEVESEQDMITQTEEETVAIKPKTEPKKEKPKEVKKPEKTAAQKAAEAKKLAEEKAERERKAAAEAARKRVAGAFGKGSQMGGSKGTAASGEGVEGSKEGNSSTGAKSGTGGPGTSGLEGWSVGIGGLPLPDCKVLVEGRVVVNIKLDSEGKVISADIGPGTNLSNETMRKAAVKAAYKARFVRKKEVTNNIGTITYKFKLN